MREVELLVVGGGAAGAAAAEAAARQGVTTLLVDERPIPLAWMSRQVPHFYGERLPTTDPPAPAAPALDAAVAAGAEVRRGTACWGLFEDNVAGIVTGARAELVRARRIVLATGSIDVPLTFAGRALSGVLDGLAALDLLATVGTLPGARRVVVLGAGAYGIAVARAALAAGHEVAALVDVHPEPAGDPEALAELEQAGVEVIPGHTVVYARGDGAVEQVMLGAVDAEGRRQAGGSFPLRADTLVVAIGRQPVIDLAYLAGCDIRWDAALGGHLPVHDARLATSAPGVAVAGDLAGTNDAAFADPALARAQGTLAGLAAAAALGRFPEANLPPLVPAPPGADRLALWQRASLAVGDDDLVVCRCELVTRGELARAMALVGDAVPDELKRMTRAGMGPCQGRGCRQLVAALLAERRGTSPATLPLASYRPPVRPIPIGAIADLELDDEQEPLHPAFAALEAQLEEDAAAGLVTPGRLAAARYKLREESHLALAGGLSDEEAARIAAALRITVRHVTVH